MKKKSSFWKHSPGWKQSSTPKTITTSEIYDYLTKIYKDIRPLTKPLEWTHHVWEEDGQHLSMWCNNNGMCTGDGGFAMFQNSLKEQAENYLKVDGFYTKN